MPLCVYLCYTPACQQKVERWMSSAQEGAAARIECPRCGEPMRCAWTGSQTPTPDFKGSGAPEP
jgi:DNA-directed RNA polymerase subunit RPC12/RpoP